MTRIVSPEFRLVATSVLAPDDVLVRRAEELSSTGLDWDRVHQLASHHSVLAMMGARLDAVIPGLLPEPLMRDCRMELTGNLALHIAQAQHVTSLVRQMSQAGVRTIILKGVPLSRTLYPKNPEWRYSSDIDLLVDPADVPLADEVLRASGHERTWPEAALASRLPQATLSRFIKDYQYASEGFAHYVELHWRLTLNPHVLALPFDELHARSAETDAGFGPMRSLDGPILLAYIAWHAIGELDHILKWFVDVIGVHRHLEERGIDIDPSGWPSHQPSLPVRIAAGIEGLLVDNLPQPALPQVQRICREMDAAQRLTAVRTLSRLPHDAAWTVALMQLVSGLRAKGWFVWRMLVDPRDAMTLGGRPLPALVYAMAGPFLALGRYLRRFVG